MMPAFWTAGGMVLVGLLLLAVLVPVVLESVLRFTRARAELRRTLGPRAAALQALAATGRSRAR